MNVEKRRAQFDSGGLRLVGDLRVPHGATGERLPAVVFTGPLSGVKEQVTGIYAQRIAEAGYVTLAFDHRNFGESEGVPRQHEDAAGKLADLSHAVSYVASLPEVDPERVAVCGVCLGGAYALRFAAFDPRVRALALVAAAFNDPREMRLGMGADGYRAQLASMAAVAQRQFAGGEIEYLPAVAADGGPALMGGHEPFAYYGTERAASPGWENRLTLLSIRELITLDAASAADFISPTPVLIVHGTRDDYCSPQAAAAVYERIEQPKRLVWQETSNHIDLYDNDEFVQPAVAEIVSWFDAHVQESPVPASA